MNRIDRNGISPNINNLESGPMIDERKSFKVLEKSKNIKKKKWRPIFIAKNLSS